MVPQITKKIPPMTAPGITDIRADNLPESPNTKRSAPPKTKTWRLATFVKQIIPALEENPVIGLVPNIEEITHDRASPMTPLLMVSVVKEVSHVLAMAIQVPADSDKSKR